MARRLPKAYSTGFVGCIKDVVVDGVELHLVEDALKQPQNITLFSRQITQQGQIYTERNGERKPLPTPAPSIALMSPAVIIFYFCILFIAFYKERKLIWCFNFCFICFVPTPLFTEHTVLFFSLLPWLFIFVFKKKKKTGISEKRDFILVSFVVLKQTPTLRKKTKVLLRLLARYLNTGGPGCRSLGAALSWCHMYHPHSPKHGVHIHDHIDTHSPPPREGWTRPTTVARQAQFL